MTVAQVRLESHPSRVRGLKSKLANGSYELPYVAPLAGAWIEIKHTFCLYRPNHVAPLAGAWIEILDLRQEQTTRRVAPLAGAWIEMDNTVLHKKFTGGRTPRGCVD